MKRIAIGLVLALMGAGSLFMAAPAQAAACANGTVLSSYNGETCDFNLTATVPTAATLTFTSAPSGAFGSVLPGATSTAQDITYALSSNGTTTTVGITCNGADNDRFQFKKEGGAFQFCNGLSGGNNTTIPYTNGAQNASHTDSVRFVAPSGAGSARNYSATLTYSVTVA